MSEDDLRPRSGLPARVATPVAESRPVPGVALTKSDRLFLQSYRVGRTLQEIGVDWAARRGAAPYKDLISAGSAAGRKLAQIRARCERGGVPEMVWEELGLGMKHIVQALAEGLEAQVVKPMVLRDETVVQLTNAQGKAYQRVVTRERIVEAGPYADGRTRVEAAKIAATLRGDIRANRAITGEAEAVDEKAPLYVFNIGGQVQVNRS